MGTCPTHHGILTDNLPEGFILPYTISTIASAPIVPGLHAIMTALDFSDILRRSNGLPAITTVTIFLVRSAIFSNNICCSSGKVRNALLAASPDWDHVTSTHTTVSSGLSFQPLLIPWLVRQFLFHLPYLTLCIRKNIASCNHILLPLLFVKLLLLFQLTHVLQIDQQQNSLDAMRLLLNNFLFAAIPISFSFSKRPQLSPAIWYAFSRLCWVGFLFPRPANSGFSKAPVITILRTLNARSSASALGFCHFLQFSRYILISRTHHINIYTGFWSWIATFHICCLPVLQLAWAQSEITVPSNPSLIPRSPCRSSLFPLIGLRLIALKSCTWP